jgi:cell filamentation protein
MSRRKFTASSSSRTDLTELHSACHTARADSDLGGLIAMFAKILDTDPAYDL